MILVTGGTGLVGSHLLYKLTNAGKNVRAIYRNESSLDKVRHIFSYFSEDVESLFNNIEWVKADLNDIPKLQNAFEGITYVYHCAALISFDPKDYRALRNTNIKGTANIVNLSISHSVKKLCYVSSIAAIGQYEDEQKLIDEETPWNTDGDHNVYAITKYGAELEVWRGTQEGLDAVIVNPGIILGAGFWDTGSGSLFKIISKGLNYYTKGITGYVDIWDVINSMTTLMESSIKNEGYILVSENLSFKDFISTTAKALKVKPPKKELKPWLLQIAWRLDWLKSKLFRTARRLTKHTATSLVSVSYYDNSKLNAAIDFKFKPIELSVKEISVLFKERD